MDYNKSTVGVHVTVLTDRNGSQKENIYMKYRKKAGKKSKRMFSHTVKRANPYALTNVRGGYRK